MYTYSICVHKYNDIPAYIYTCVADTAGTYKLAMPSVS